MQNTTISQTAPTKESVIADMLALPPNKSLEDKYYLGFFCGEQLIAVADITGKELS